METAKISELEDLTYFINLDWFQRTDRSFAVIAQRCLCPACQERLASKPDVMLSVSLIENIRDCCSKTPNFISFKLPLLEKVFRLFISKGNEPISLAELIMQLSLYSNNSVSLSPSTLKRLLDNNKYYGFCQVL